MIAQLMTLVPLMTSWESCALSLIDKHRPSSVFFACHTYDECPSNSLYNKMSTTSQTFFGLDIHDLPPFRDTDLVFMPSNGASAVWNNATTQKYRNGGKNEFMLVVFANVTVTDTKFMDEFFASMWESGIVKSAVVLTNGTSNMLYTYIPFQSGGVCEDTSPVLLGECSSAADSVFDLTFKIKNLNKCPIRVTVVDSAPWIQSKPLTGRFVKFTQEIAIRMNFSIAVITPEDGEVGVCTPEEHTGARGDLVYGKAHLALATFDVRVCPYIKYISLPMYVCFAWCTPLLSERNYVFMFLLKQFHLQVWLTLLSSVILVVLSVLFLCSATNEHYKSSDIINIALVVYAPVPPHNFRTTPLRLVVTFWLFTCLVIRTAYEAELKSQSAVPLGSRIIYDLEELLEAGLHLCSARADLQSLKSMDGPLEKKIASKTQVCKGSVSGNIVAAAKLGDRAVYTSEASCKLMLTTLTFDGAYLFPKTGGCTRWNQVLPMATLKGSPFKETFQRLLNRCMDAGLIFKWLDLRTAHRKSESVQRYSLTNLLPALFVLGIGCIAGFVSLLFEITVHGSLSKRGDYKRIY